MHAALSGSGIGGVLLYIPLGHSDDEDESSVTHLVCADCFLYTVTLVLCQSCPAIYTLSLPLKDKRDDSGSTIYLPGQLRRLHRQIECDILSLPLKDWLCV